MLMLVVTIIIAAVVSMSASGLLSNEKPTPSIAATATLSATNGLDFTLTGASDPVSLNDLQIILSTQAEKTYYSRTLESGSTTPLLFGETIPFPTAKSLQSSTEDKEFTKVNINSTTFDKDGKSKFTNSWAQVQVWQNDSNHDDGAKLWYYNVTTDGKKYTNYTDLKDNDPKVASFTKMQGSYAKGEDWYYNLVEVKEEYKIGKNDGVVSKYLTYDLKAGDKVDVSIIYIPSGKQVFTKTVTVGA